VEGKEGENLEQSSRVQAVCDWFGPSDVKALAATNPAAYSAVAKALGTTLEEQKEKMLQASPVTYVSQNVSPFLIADRFGVLIVLLAAGLAC
jgi:hypothetical protein